MPAVKRSADLVHIKAVLDPSRPEEQVGVEYWEYLSQRSRGQATLHDLFLTAALRWKAAREGINLDMLGDEERKA